MQRFLDWWAQVDLVNAIFQLFLAAVGWLNCLESRGTAEYLDARYIK